MVLNIAPKLIQSHGWISIKAQLKLVIHIEIDKNQPKWGLIINLKLKPLSKFRTEQNTVSTNLLMIKF